MLTIFSCPKPFEGPAEIAQKNAIKSWLNLFPRCEIFLFGNDKGIAEIAKELKVNHVPEVEKNEFGTPLFSSIFKIAQERASNQILTYLNTDIILLNDFIPSLLKVDLPLYLLTGRRFDLDVKELIDFIDRHWEKRLRKNIFEKGKLHGFSGIDYYVFPRNLKLQLPPFTVGRVGWDNWLFYHTKKSGIPIIDATPLITIIHQNHSYPHKKKSSFKIETERNIKLAGGLSCMLTIREADFILTKKGLERPKSLRWVFSHLALFYPWRMMFLIKRKLQRLIINIFKNE